MMKNSSFTGGEKIRDYIPKDEITLFFKRVQTFFCLLTQTILKWNGIVLQGLILFSQIESNLRSQS